MNRPLLIRKTDELSDVDACEAIVRQLAGQDPPYGSTDLRNAATLMHMRQADHRVDEHSTAPCRASAVRLGSTLWSEQGGISAAQRHHCDARYMANMWRNRSSAGLENVLNFVDAVVGFAALTTTLQDDSPTQRLDPVSW